MLKEACVTVLHVSSLVCFLPSYLPDYPMLVCLALFSGVVNLILPFCILLYSPSFVVSFFMLACIFLCVFGAFLFELPFPSLSHIFFSLFFLGGEGDVLFLHTSLFPPLHLSPSYLLPLALLLFLPYECHFSPFLPLLFTHTHTSGRDMAWVHQGRMELVPNWQGTACFMCYCKCKRTRTGALTVLPVLLLKDIYEEHQTPLWSFRSRPFSAAIT